MYDIVGKRNWFFALSAILTIPGLIFIIMGGLRPSIDFTGGTEWEVRYAEEPSAAEMTAALEERGYEDVVVTELPGGYLRIRTEPIDLLPAVLPEPVPSGSVLPSASVSPSRARQRSSGTPEAAARRHRRRPARPLRRPRQPADRDARADAGADRRGHRVRRAPG